VPVTIKLKISSILVNTIETGKMHHPTLYLFPPLGQQTFEDQFAQQRINGERDLAGDLRHEEVGTACGIVRSGVERNKTVVPEDVEAGAARLGICLWRLFSLLANSIFFSNYRSPSRRESSFLSRNNTFFTPLTGAVSSSHSHPAYHRIRDYPGVSYGPDGNHASHPCTFACTERLVYRMGNRRPVLAQYLLESFCIHTLEERIKLVNEGLKIAPEKQDLLMMKKQLTER
jgi:hypothetical protein